MAYYPQQNRKRLSVGADGNALMNLIALLLIVFVTFAFIQVVYTFTYYKEGAARYHAEMFPWIALPADLSTLASRPWTLLTHFFVHDGIWPVIGNLLWLWAFGSIYQNMTGYRKLIPLFLYGSVAGGVAFLIAYNGVPALHAHAAGTQLWGAGAGVMAIAIATTVLAPNFRIYPMLNGGIPLWVITVAYAVLSLAFIPLSETGTHIAYLAGALIGFLFQRAQDNGRDWSGWINRAWDWWVNLFNPDKHKPASPKDELFYKATVPPFKKSSNFTQQRVDEILDKINQKGFKSLTEEERDILRKASGDNPA